MTNQEAISVLESIDAKTDYYLINDDARAEAIDMAISALQEQEAKHSSDLISRREAIDTLLAWMWPIPINNQETIESDEMIFVRNILEALPSAQPETAKRIVGKSRNGMTLWYQCDMCNEPVDAQDNFCRGCGRRLTDG